MAAAYAADSGTLVADGCQVDPEVVQPGYVRAVLRRGDSATKVEWSYDSSWRFMPLMKSEDFGYQLHPIDLATNKVLALAGRDEPRDLLDTLYLHRNVLELGPLVWAATGKDPGYSPLSMLEMLRRRGKVRPEDLDRLHLTEPVDLHELKTQWLRALEEAENFARTRPPDEAGCLYYAPTLERFVNPNTHEGEVVTHYGRPGGVLPRFR